MQAQPHTEVKTNKNTNNKYYQDGTQVFYFDALKPR